MGGRERRSERRSGRRNVLFILNSDGLSCTAREIHNNYQASSSPNRPPPAISAPSDLEEDSFLAAAAGALPLPAAGAAPPGAPDPTLPASSTISFGLLMPATFSKICT